MTPDTVPTDRPPRQRPGHDLLVATGDVARYGPAAAIVIAALTAAAKPVTFADLGVRTGLDPGGLLEALVELSCFHQVRADPGGWRLRDELTDLRAHVDRTVAGAELEASNIPPVVHIARGSRCSYRVSEVETLDPAEVTCPACLAGGVR
jgi:hypothetical protein